MKKYERVTAIDVLPGLGPAATIALLLPITHVIGSPLSQGVALSIGIPWRISLEQVE